MIKASLSITIPFTFENTSFRVLRFWWRATHKGAGLARYFKPLQQRHSPKDSCYRWGILERERYIKRITINKAYLALAMTLSVAASAWADQDSNLRLKGPHFGEDGWDVSLGLGVSHSESTLYRGYDDSQTGLWIIGDARYRKGRFFLSAPGYDIPAIGYSVIQKENWVVDTVFTPLFAVSFEGNSELEHLEDRDYDGHLGLNYSGYGDNNRITLWLSQDVINTHDGWAASAAYEHEWQVKNWLITGSAMVAHVSDKMTNYYAGVSNSKATAAIPAFNAQAGNVVSLNLRAEYPVNEKWVFQTTLNTFAASDEISNSPIINDDTAMSFVTGLKYQF